MRNKDLRQVIEVVEVDGEELISAPCYNCPYDNPRECDCSVCEMEDS